MAFEKTLSLGGYPIKALAAIFPGLTTVDESKKNYKIRGSEGITTEIIWTKLNASLNLTISNDQTWGVIYKNGSADGWVGEVLQGKFDFLIHQRSDENLWINQYYVYKQLDLCYVYKKKLFTVEERVIDIISSIHILVYIFAFIILSIILMYLNKIRFSQAAADLLRSIIGTPTLRVPLSVKSKVTFICLIFLFMLITSGSYVWFSFLCW